MHVIQTHVMLQKAFYSWAPSGVYQRGTMSRNIYESDRYNTKTYLCLIAHIPGLGPFQINYLKVWFRPLHLKFSIALSFVWCQGTIGPNYLVQQEGKTKGLFQRLLPFHHAHHVMDLHPVHAKVFGQPQLILRIQIHSLLLGKLVEL